MEQYCIYLRKSRADAEAELHGEGETLSRHEKILSEYAKKLRFPILEIHKEIVSGETIAARPVMQKLLQEVENGLWAGVLVMEVERLARGDTIDQGIVSRTFKLSQTKIITPMKTYDPNNEFDEEYFEFGLFMSRREYKTINRRLQQGRTTSVKEGKYLGSCPPYGYKRIKLEKEKGYSLQPFPEEAETVQYIFQLYINGEQQDNNIKTLGFHSIAHKLNQLGIPSQRGHQWTTSSIKSILTNPIYIGKIRWNYRPRQKKSKQGTITVSRPVNHQSCTIVDGRHESIIPLEVWDKAQKRFHSVSLPAIPANKECKNPLAGLVICAECKSKMQRRPHNKYGISSLICKNDTCNNISSKLNLVENKILEALGSWYNGYTLQWKEQNPLSTFPQENFLFQAYKKTTKDLSELETQLQNIYAFLEKGIYTPEVFQNRYSLLTTKIEETKQILHTIESEHKQAASIAHIVQPKQMNFIETYHHLAKADYQNQFLKSILTKVEYRKTVNGRWHNQPDEFELIIFPLLPCRNKHRQNNNEPKNLLI